MHLFFYVPEERMWTWSDGPHGQVVEQNALTLVTRQSGRTARQALGEPDRCRLEQRPINECGNSTLDVVEGSVGPINEKHLVSSPPCHYPIHGQGHE